MFYAQTTANGHAKENAFRPQVKQNSDSLLNTHSTVEDWINLGKIE